MRIEFWTPEDPVSEEILSDVLSLVGVYVGELARIAIRSWTKHERIMAYDWAMRIHYRASDNNTRLRPRPSFVLASWGGEK